MARYPPLQGLALDMTEKNGRSGANDNDNAYTAG